MISRKYLLDEIGKLEERIYNIERDKRENNVKVICNEIDREKLKKCQEALLKRIEKLEYQISSEEKRCKISKDYDFALFIKNGKTYLYRKGKNVGGECKHFKCTYDFEIDTTKYKMEY